MSNRTSTDMWYKRHCGDRAKEVSKLSLTSMRHPDCTHTETFVLDQNT